MPLEFGPETFQRPMHQRSRRRFVDNVWYFERRMDGHLMLIIANPNTSHRHHRRLTADRQNSRTQIDIHARIAKGDDLIVFPGDRKINEHGE